MSIYYLGVNNEKFFYNFKFIILFALLLVMNYLTLASEDDTKALKILTDAYNYDKGLEILYLLKLWPWK